MCERRSARGGFRCTFASSALSAASSDLLAAGIAAGIADGIADGIGFAAGGAANDRCSLRMPSAFGASARPGLRLIASVCADAERLLEAGKAFRRTGLDLCGCVCAGE